MRFAALAVWLAVVAPAAAAGQSLVAPREVRFSGPSAMDELCACLIDARRNSEAQGHLDFTAEVASVGTDGLLELSARISEGSAYAVGRIDFTGHSGTNDSSLRRVMTIYERDMLDLGELRRSLARINAIGVFEPLTLADVRIARQDDGVTADLTIPLRERKRRGWSLSGRLLPDIGTLQASVSSRLPPWGRGVFEATTYFVSLNMAGFGTPFLALQRPVIPGQELLSGFAVSPVLSPHAMLTHYGRTHLAYGIATVLNDVPIDSLAAQITSTGPQLEPFICVPPKPRLRWLRRGATVVSNIALTAVIP